MIKKVSQKLHNGEKILAEWKAPEFRNIKKLKNYWFGALAVGFFLVFWAIYYSNYLFVFIILISLFLIYSLLDYRPKNYKFIITDSGVWVNDKLYRFIESDRFWVAPYATKKDRFFILHFPGHRDRELRLPIPRERLEELRLLINEYVPQSEHKLSLFDLIEQTFL
ncbi:MAG: hypothetical protein AB1721_01555 [Patescibacteria group bacterium]